MEETITLTVSSANPLPLIPEIRETPNGFEITTIQSSDYNAKTSLSFIEIHKKLTPPQLAFNKK